MCIEKGKTMSSVTVVIIKKTIQAILIVHTYIYRYSNISSCFAIVNER